MRALQLWGNARYPEELVRYTRSVLDIVGPDNYSLFCNNREISDALGVEYQNFDAEISRILNVIQCSPWWLEYCSNNMFKSDMVRLFHACEYDDLLYLDADIELLHKPIATSSKPLMADGDFCGFYVNGNTDWFRRFMHEITARLKPEPYSIYNYLSTKFMEIGNIQQDAYIRHDFGIKWTEHSCS